MPRPLLLVSLATVICLASLRAAQQEPKAEKPDDEFKMSKIEKEILDRTNAERKKNDLPELKPNPLLFAAARKHSENMARQDKLDHNLDGKKPNERIKDAGYRGSYIGENIAYGQMSAEEVVKGWMGSEPHRKNILGDKYTEIGLGVAKSAKGTVYFTQVFARPAK